jgi:hypothetical protein
MEAKMSVFYFVPVDDEGTYESPEPFEHSSLARAVAQAHELLAEMAVDGILLRCVMLNICRLFGCHSN